ncbi:hypothetical protein [Escherichia coli]|uniref:hypothetical protein n=1 Tax=Escherichia coli TaxID=562 RepID=UPI001F496DBD|nr:hypothetical protein [Escherichia coli]MCH6980744.1 hypothetical protein [Escherichia coli]HDW9323858.1 hypothetical protein [Escherichia coli]
MTDITELAQREKFEAWLSPRWDMEKFIDDDGDEQYVEDYVQGAWMGFSAANTELVEALEKAQQRIAELESSGVAPGILRCTECSFVQTKNIISVTADTISTVESESESCPNGCGQLQPVTWKALAIQLMFTTKQGVSDFLEAKKRIAELESRTVTVKPMRPGHIKVGGEKIGIYMRDEVDEFIAALTAAGIKVEAE